MGISDKGAQMQFLYPLDLFFLKSFSANQLQIGFKWMGMDGQWQAVAYLEICSLCDQQGN